MSKCWGLREERSCTKNVKATNTQIISNKQKRKGQAGAQKNRQTIRQDHK